MSAEFEDSTLLACKRGRIKSLAEGAQKEAIKAVGDAKVAVGAVGKLCIGNHRPATGLG